MAVDDSYTKLLLHMDGSDNATTFIDEANNVCVATGNACLKTAIKKFGSASGYFDGSGDKVTVTSSTDFDFGAGDFTIDLWAYFTTVSKGYQMFFDRRTTSDATGWLFYLESNNTINFLASTGSGWQCTVLTGSGIIPPLNEWCHLAVVRYGNVFTLYLNGVPIQTGVWTGTIGAVTTNPTVGGAHAFGADFQGYLDEVRVSKGIARWVTSFTPPTNPFIYDPTYMKLLLHMDGEDSGVTFTDEAGKVITPSGNACTKIAQKQFGTASAYFDSSGDYLTIPDSADFALGTGDYTIEFWAYIIAWGTDCSIFKVLTNGGLQIGKNGSSSSWGTRANGVAWKITAGTLPTFNVWHHFAITRINGSERIFLDGVLVARGANAYSYTQGSLQIGSSGLNMYLDEVCIQKGFAKYTANFVPPIGQYMQPPFEPSGTAVFGPYVLPPMKENPASTSIDWVEDVPTDTTLTVYAAIAAAEPLEADYLLVTKGGNIPGISYLDAGKNLYVKCYLTTADTTKSPRFSGLVITFIGAAENNKILLCLKTTNRMRYPNGGVRVQYQKALGNLVGPGSAQVEDFDITFAPIGITPLFAPNKVEQITTLSAITLSTFTVTYKEGQTQENITALSAITLVVTKVGSLPL